MNKEQLCKVLETEPYKFGEVLRKIIVEKQNSEAENIATKIIKDFFDRLTDPLVVWAYHFDFKTSPSVAQLVIFYLKKLYNINSKITSIPQSDDFTLTININEITCYKTVIKDQNGDLVYKALKT